MFSKTKTQPIRIMKTIKYLFLLIVFLLNVSNCYSVVRRYVDVQYETSRGWSEKYRIEVTFATAKELSQATYDYRYGISGAYAIIWFSREECAIIKMEVSPIVAVESKFTDQTLCDIFRIKSYVTGIAFNSDDDRKWQITARTLFGFIDDRITGY